MHGKLIAVSHDRIAVPELYPGFLGTFEGVGDT
jgi:hypothetical protein